MTEVLEIKMLEVVHELGTFPYFSNVGLLTLGLVVLLRVFIIISPLEIFVCRVVVAHEV